MKSAINAPQRVGYPGLFQGCSRVASILNAFKNKSIPYIPGLEAQPIYVYTQIFLIKIHSHSHIGLSWKYGMYGLVLIYKELSVDISME
jgi:hypothetical protein